MNPHHPMQTLVFSFFLHGCMQAAFAEVCSNAAIGPSDLLEDHSSFLQVGLAQTSAPNTQELSRVGAHTAEGDTPESDGPESDAAKLQLVHDLLANRARWNAPFMAVLTFGTTCGARALECVRDATSNGEGWDGMVQCSEQAARCARTCPDAGGESLLQ